MTNFLFVIQAFVWHFMVWKFMKTSAKYKQISHWLFVPALQNNLVFVLLHTDSLWGRAEAAAQVKHRVRGAECHPQQAHWYHEGSHREARGGNCAAEEQQFGLAAAPHRLEIYPHHELLQPATARWAYLYFQVFRCHDHITWLLHFTVTCYVSVLLCL